MRRLSADVVIIGTGGAGMMAALAAAEQGLSLIEILMSDEISLPQLRQRSGILKNSIIIFGLGRLLLLHIIWGKKVL
ncbi:FAD-binding protein [Thermodesulfobacteriota bacterium]